MDKAGATRNRARRGMAASVLGLELFLSGCATPQAPAPTTATSQNPTPVGPGATATTTQKPDATAVPDRLGNALVADPRLVLDLGDDASGYRVGAAVLNGHVVPVYQTTLREVDTNVAEAIADQTAWIFNPDIVKWGRRQPDGNVTELSGRNALYYDDTRGSDVTEEGKWVAPVVNGTVGNATALSLAFSTYEDRTLAFGVTTGTSMVDGIRLENHLRSASGGQPAQTASDYFFTKLDDPESPDKLGALDVTNMDSFPANRAVERGVLATVGG